MYRVLPILTDDEVGRMPQDRRRRRRSSTAGSPTRTTRPSRTSSSTTPAPTSAAAELLRQALVRSEEFRNFAFPAQIAPPLMTRYKPGMKYGAHTDAAFLQLPGGNHPQRPQLHDLPQRSRQTMKAARCTSGSATPSCRFKLQPGEAIVYPSDTLHEVEPVTKGERLVAITFIQSRIQDPFRRNLLYNLNEVAALEGAAT